MLDWLCISVGGLKRTGKKKPVTSLFVGIHAFKESYIAIIILVTNRITGPAVTESKQLSSQVLLNLLDGGPEKATSFLGFFSFAGRDSVWRH